MKQPIAWVAPLLTSYLFRFGMHTTLFTLRVGVGRGLGAKKLNLVLGGVCLPHQELGMGMQARLVTHVAFG